MPACSLHDYSYDELRSLLVQDGLRPAHVATVWNALHFKAEPDIRTCLPGWVPPLQRWAFQKLEAEGCWQDTLDISSHIPSSDGLTQKFLLRLRDGQEIETVLMGYTGRYTVCVSTQAGCAMGCVFCATGQMGFVRHLRPGEIVGQVLHARRILRARGERLRNIVLMGMGEPMHNYENVMKALAMISDTRGCNIGPSKISISTVGVVPGIRRLADEDRPYNLAISLHGSTEEERAALIPANQRWPLHELISACRYYWEKTGRRIFFAWTLIAGVNDTAEHARRVVTLLSGLDAHLNLIPLNETAGYGGRESADSSAGIFHQIIQAGGIPCTIRQRRGIDVAAGCGQLKAVKNRASRSAPASVSI